MAIAMVVWMRVRGHGWRGTVEMAAAMLVPFLVLLVPYWAGGLTESALMAAGHTLMMVAMLAGHAAAAGRVHPRAPRRRPAAPA
jgi:peptidoglycan/LPS O-acetylase OafA/YrhL